MPRGNAAKIRRSMMRGGAKYYYIDKGKPMDRYTYWLSKIKDINIDLYNDMKNKPPRNNIQVMHIVFNDFNISKDLTELSRTL